MSSIALGPLSVAILSVIIVYIVYKLIIQPLTSPLRKIPGLPYTNPFLGNLKLLMTGEAFETGIKLHQKYGAVYRFYFAFGQARISVNDPAIFKHVLVNNVKNYVKPKEYIGIVAKLLGNGLVTSEGAVHTTQKRLMAPSFSNQSVNKMIPVFEKHIRKLTDYWSKRLNNTPDIAIHEDLKCTTLDIIGETAFGYKFHNLENRECDAAIAFQEILSGARLSWKLMIPLYSKLPTAENKRSTRHLTLMNDIVFDIISKKRKQIETETDLDSLTRDVLGMLMVAKDDVTSQGLSDVELRDQIVTLMLAGHETTAVAMSWCLLMLADHPKIQQRAREEIREVFESDSEITGEKLEALQYCGWVIKETLRMFPPAAVTIRMAEADDVLPGGYFIPARTILNISLFITMRDARYFNDPDTFNPERFADKAIEANLYQYLPFLIGSKMCLGHRFAMTELKIMLVMFLRRLQFARVPGSTYKRKIHLTLRPDPSLQLRVSVLDN